MATKKNGKTNGATEQARVDAAPQAASGLTVQFVAKENGPERLVAEAELYLGAVLPGVKIVGFTLWRGADGEVYVTFPSRAFGASGDRRFFDYVRPINGDNAGVKALKQRIVDAYKNSGGVGGPKAIPTATAAL